MFRLLIMPVVLLISALLFIAPDIIAPDIIARDITARDVNAACITAGRPLTHRHWLIVTLILLKLLIADRVANVKTELPIRLEFLWIVELIGRRVVWKS